MRSPLYNKIIIRRFSSFDYSSHTCSSYGSQTLISNSIKSNNCIIENRLSKDRFVTINSRGYRHWTRASSDDFGLPLDSMPEDIEKLMNSEPNTLGYVDSYWYHRIKGESTLLNPATLVRKSYEEIASDMGLPVVDESSEHMMGIIELYEYLKSAPMVGPFGTIENPVIVPAIGTERVVGCTGGVGDDEHVPLFFRCQDGFLYRCAECDQIFMLVRVHYGDYACGDGNREENKNKRIKEAKNTDIKRLYDFKEFETVNKMWNKDSMRRWPAGELASKMRIGTVE